MTTGMIRVGISVNVKLTLPVIKVTNIREREANGRFFVVAFIVV